MALGVRWPPPVVEGALLISPTDSYKGLISLVESSMVLLLSPPKSRKPYRGAMRRSAGRVRCSLGRVGLIALSMTASQVVALLAMQAMHCGGLCPPSPAPPRRSVGRVAIEPQPMQSNYPYLGQTSGQRTPSFLYGLKHSSECNLTLLVRFGLLPPPLV